MHPAAPHSKDQRQQPRTGLRLSQPKGPRELSNEVCHVCINILHLEKFIHTVMSSENVTQDGLVRKTVLAEGSGEPPPLHARCLGNSCNNVAILHSSTPPPAPSPLVRYGLKPSAEPAVLSAVHYVSRLAETQQVLVDTRDEGGDDPMPLVAGRGADPLYVV